MKVLKPSNPEYYLWMSGGLLSCYYYEQVSKNGVNYSLARAAARIFFLTGCDEDQSTADSSTLFFDDEHGLHVVDGNKELNPVSHLKLSGTILAVDGLPANSYSYLNPLTYDYSYEDVFITSSPFSDRLYAFDNDVTLRIFCRQIDEYEGCPVFALCEEYRNPKSKYNYSGGFTFIWDSVTKRASAGSVSSWFVSTGTIQDHSLYNTLSMVAGSWHKTVAVYPPTLQVKGCKKLNPISVRLSSPSNQWRDYFPELTSNIINWNALAGEAYEELGFFEGNGIAYTADVARMGKSVKQTLATLRRMSRGKAKAAASLFLSFHYGYSLFLKDTQELYDSLGRIDFLSRCQAHCSVDTIQGSHVECRYQCWYHPWEQVRSLLRQLLEASDISLEASNLWDLIPFSFVVDWFTNVGDILESFDNYMSLEQYHRVVCSSRSIKATRELSLHQVASGGIVINKPVVSYYQRQYFDCALGPEYHLSFSNPLTSLTSHWLEAGALYVSKR